LCEDAARIGSGRFNVIVHSQANFSTIAAGATSSSKTDRHTCAANTCARACDHDVVSTVAASAANTLRKHANRVGS
jgi:hypothetical protein